MHLAELAMEFALEHLKLAGSFLVKSFRARGIRGVLQADAQPFR
jgi:23S rRNA U2552 (ribose-2'-O)-methylase RlmE/FtsJ